MTSRPSGESIPKQMQPVFNGLAALIDPFCLAHLNDEYADLSRRLAAALCRKRPSPLLSGKLQTWACAIVYTIGSVNFLFDRSQTPHMSAADLAAGFGVAQSTASSKSKTIRDLMKIDVFDWHWTLPSRLADNPLAWMIQVNGLLVDARRVPREIQEDAFRKGLIPYVPAAQS